MKIINTWTAAIILTLALLAAALLLPAVPALAAYTQEASTFSAGGGEASSGSYTNLGVIGQPGIIGSSSSGTYAANHGFLSVLGDGFKILYPVITATPGSFTFTLAANGTGNRTLGISNTGGSTLKWSIAKQQADSIFSVSSGTGTDAGNITVTAEAGSLPVGPYSNTLIISGSGIEQTAQVLLTINRTAANTFSLTVSVRSSSDTKGGGNIFDGSGTIDCSAIGLNQTGTCVANLAPDSSITLLQLPDSNSTLAMWGGDCNGSSNCAIANISDNMAVSATFPYSSMAIVTSTGTGYESLVFAYNDPTTLLTDTINARAVPFVEGTPGSIVTLNGGKTINLVGGLDANYAPTTNFTTLQNVLKIRSGQLNIKGGLKLLSTP